MPRIRSFTLAWPLYGNANLLDHIPKWSACTPFFCGNRGTFSPPCGARRNPRPGWRIFWPSRTSTRPAKSPNGTFRPTHLPWVTAGQKPVFADPAGTLLALAAPDFDPRRTVFLPPEARPLVTVSNASPVKVSVRRFSAHTVRLESEASEPALVVIAQSFYHNWRAYVAGHPARLLRANHAFQALQVPAGRHQVTLAYADRMFYYGGLSRCFQPPLGRRSGFGDESDLRP